MSRDHTLLKVFEMADELVIEVYGRTKDLPTKERYGLQSQIRRAAVSVPTNIVEGCSRKGLRDYIHFLRIAVGSASEVRYLVEISDRLGFLNNGEGSYMTANMLRQKYTGLVKALESLITSLEEKL